MNLQDETREEVEKLQQELGESETPKEDESKEESSEKTEEGESTVEETQEKTPEKVSTEQELPASAQKRIDELVYKYKSEREARQKLEEQLKQSRQNPSQPTSEEEQREKTAREYLRNLLREELDATKKAEQEAQNEADKALEDECDHVAAIYSDFKKEDVLKVMEKYKITDVEAAYLNWKEMNRVAEEAKEKVKKDITSKPKSPSAEKTQDGFATKFSDEVIGKESIFELAERAKKEAGYN